MIGTCTHTARDSGTQPQAHTIFCLIASLPGSTLLFRDWGYSIVPVVSSRVLWSPHRVHLMK